MDWYFVSFDLWKPFFCCDCWVDDYTEDPYKYWGNVLPDLALFVKHFNLQRYVIKSLFLLFVGDLTFITVGGGPGHKLENLWGPKSCLWENHDSNNVVYKNNVTTHKIVDHLFANI